MRSYQRPEGLPWEELVRRFKGSTGAVKEKMTAHTAIALLAAAVCLTAVREGRFFLIGNPAQSHLWQLPFLKELAKVKGVSWVTLHSRAFGGDRRKHTGLLSNMPGLTEGCEKLCQAREERAPRDYSGVPHK